MKKVIALLLTLIISVMVIACGEKPAGGGGSVNKDGLLFSENTITTSVGKTERVTVTVEENYAGEENNFTWTSSDASVATVSTASKLNQATGVIKALKVGTTVVTVTGSNGKSASLNVTVQAQFEAEEDYLYPRIFETVKFPISDVSGVTFESSDTSVATVATDGTISALKIGTATITATRGTATVSVEVTVGGYTGEFCVVGETLQLPVTVAGVTFTSSATGVATVSNSGLITGVSAGTSTITMTKGDVSTTVNLTVLLSKERVITMSATKDSRLNYYGRTQFVSGKGQMFYFTSSGFDVTFYGTELKADLSVNNGSASTAGKVRLSIFVDGESMTATSVSGSRMIEVNQSGVYTLASGLSKGVHTVKVRKRTAYQRGDTFMNEFGLKELTITDSDGGFGQVNAKSDFRMDVYGDSISCGFGNLTDGGSMTSENTDGMMAYHTLLANSLGIDYNIMAASGWGIMWDTAGNATWNWPDHYTKITPRLNVNYGAGGADLIVINLGTNDASGIGKTGNTPQMLTDKLKGWLQDLRAANPTAPIVCTYGMMGINSSVQSAINAAVADLADAKIKTFYYSGGAVQGSGHPVVSHHKAAATQLETFLVQNNFVPAN